MSSRVTSGLTMLLTLTIAACGGGDPEAGAPPPTSNSAAPAAACDRECLIELTKTYPNCTDHGLKVCHAFLDDALVLVCVSKVSIRDPAKNPMYFPVDAFDDAVLVIQNELWDEVRPSVLDEFIDHGVRREGGVSIIFSGGLDDRLDKNG